MKMRKENPHSPRKLEDLPDEVQILSSSLLDGLKEILADNLYGVYLFGALVFPESRNIQDIDFFVINKRPLTARESEGIRQLHEKLAQKFPQIGNELDGHYILLDDARQTSPPRLQVFHPDLFNDSWALHRAHIRAGYYITLDGPEPDQIFPPVTWPELAAGLEAERQYIEKYINTYAAYCILNSCRLLYSYRTKDVVISKQASAEWALDNFTVWEDPIKAALRSYAGEPKGDDKKLLESEAKRFYQFACKIIDTINAEQ